MELNYFIEAIVEGVFQFALNSTGLGLVSDTIKIYTRFQRISNSICSIRTITNCGNLGVCGLELIIDDVSEKTIDRLLQIGETSISVSNKNDRAYVSCPISSPFFVSLPSVTRGSISQSGKSSISDCPKGELN